MDLTFDNSGTKSSVEPAIAGLFAMAEIMDMSISSPQDKKRPPRVALRWTGNTLPEMTGVIEALSVRYTEFVPNGTPVTAQVVLTFREASRASFKKK